MATHPPTPPSSQTPLGGRLRRARAAGLALTLTVCALATVTATSSATATPAPAAAPAASTSERAVGTLTVSPAVHVAGQAVTFQGRLPKPGRRAIRLQFHMNRPGDKWTDVKNGKARTSASGAFKFRFPAPSMFKIRYRVAGGGMVTAPHLFYAKPQAVSLSVNGQDEKDQFVTVPPALPYTVEVDSAADLYPARRLEPPTFAGRVITLQERVNGNQWRTVATRKADAAGIALFPLTAAPAGERVLRARAEDVTAGGHRIGWTPSWPTYVRFASSDLPIREDDGPDRAARVRAATAPDSSRYGVASSSWGWHTPRYDWAWEFGESLTSAPFRGQVLKGRWLDASSGSGRASVFNGALAFQSRLILKGEGDRGTTSATVSGNAQTYGRWEFSAWQNVFEDGARNYRMRLELVPQGAAAVACSPEAIQVADMEIGSRSYSVGVRSARAKAQWRHTKTSTPAASGVHAFAVEVAKDHITWFFDGKAFATVKRNALAGKALVPRMSLVGADDATEHNGSQFSVDWVRAWSLKTGRQARTGKVLGKSAYSATC
ncbi:family 16 glycosylhydrolase [Nocardioides sp. cx-173]|uniref:family 16 glycosylhydrolase n=1 Tax=Nocardioides sp. cx-173 TaxID=2898796 RepID=UPI001E483066|nr:family 16 glycosylhydrolase [Nocardioides sp. cx-173]MCD4524856.1 family 16 glycosylhydrolase [Nocardioides sp. cx-173]UGB43360.1 family 16 glycosylhydrolase [Nocardioides sp. cx-173]